PRRAGGRAARRRGPGRHGRPPADRRPGAEVAAMQSTAHAFKDNAQRALHDPRLQRAMENPRHGFQERRRVAAAALPEFEQLRDIARDIKNHTLANLDWYLERYEEKVLASGGRVHWCRTAAEAR